MEKTLLKIANTLVVNTQNFDRVGLLKGLTGVALFLYEYSYLTKYEMYNNLADDMLDNIFESTKNMALTDMAYGLSGIGWSVEYLIQKNFVEGDPDEVLEDVHIKLLENIKNKTIDSNIDIPLSNYGLYIISRIRNKNVDENYLWIIKDILNLNSKALESEDALSFVYLNSIIYFLIFMEKRNICNDEITIGLNKLPNVISKSIEAGLFDYSDYETFLLLIELADQNRNDNWAELIRFRNNWNFEEADFSIDRFMKNTWQSLFYPEIIYFNNMDFDFEKIVEEKQLCLINDNITMANGLVGIGLGIIQRFRDSGVRD